MGKYDRCAIGKCNNARVYKENYVIKPHIGAFDGSLQLRFWKCTDPKLYAKWTFNCNRWRFKVNKHTVVCSNHFKYGRPTKLSPSPTLYLKGYEPDDTETKQVRRVLKRRSIEEVGCVNTPCKERKVSQSASLKENTGSVPENLQAHTTNCESVPCPTPVPSQPTLSSGIKKKVPIGSTCTNDDAKVPRSLKKTMSWDMIKARKRLVKFYTGCPTAEIFMFIVDHVRPKHKKLQYYRGSSSTTTTPKKYQISPVTQFCQRKPGKPRMLSLEDEILMTLMRIRLDAPVEDLAFRFGMSSANASNTITTFILFLSLELEPLIYWPTAEETLSYTHPHFAGNFHKCEGIGDCTEQYIEHSKNTDAQYQTYSTYKSHNTLKKLIFCTKSGSISYISPTYAGSCSDRFITEDTNVAAKFTPGFMAMFDKGFNVQDLFLHQQVKCVLPPLVRSKRQFTRSEVYQGKRIARARIHVERVMGRLKEFRLLKNILPLTMIDLCDQIWIIAGAIVNMQPPLIK